MVKLRSDQERVKALLKETITLLCKNGLEYKNRFCVDALIGITLDEDDVFLVKITETVGEKGFGNGAPTHIPPTAPVVALPTLTQQPMYDVQVMKDCHHAPSNDSISDIPPQRASPTLPHRSTPQPTNERKRRASSSPVRDEHEHVEDVTVPVTSISGASSCVSDITEQSVPINELPEPISIQPEELEAEEPENLVKVKEENVSDCENDSSAVQTAPLNMSTMSSKAGEGANSEEPGCSTWDPSQIQQQVAQAAAAALSGSPKPDELESSTPNNQSATSDQDSSSWSLLKTALKTKQKGGRQPKEDGVGYFFALSTPQYSLEKRYVCDFAGCNYTSSRKYNLMRHGRTHHEDQRIPCPECPGTFVDKYILKEHMAAAHPKFTIPIEGTNVIGVGIGDTKKEGSPANKRKRTVPSHNPSPKRVGGIKSKDTPSPGKPRRSGGWHIPRLSPMVIAPAGEDKYEANVSGISPLTNNNDTSASMQVVFPGMDMMGIDTSTPMVTAPVREDEEEVNESAKSPATNDDASNNNNNVSKDTLASMQVVFPGMGIDASTPMAKSPVCEDKDEVNESAISSVTNNDTSNNNKFNNVNNVNKDTLASMQVVFPGMNMMDIDNNNTPKETEAADLSTGMQVVFPGMEMVQQDDSNGPESDNSPAKERSMIETSDGEEAKISE